MSAGSELYQRMLDYWKDRPRELELNRKAWGPTPYMVDVFTGRTGADQDMEIRRWCLDEFGKESAPLIGHDGTWRRGSATIDGWTWYGFATEDMMRRFVERWGDSERAEP